MEDNEYYKKIDRSRFYEIGLQASVVTSEERKKYLISLFKSDNGSCGYIVDKYVFKIYLNDRGYVIREYRDEWFLLFVEYGDDFYLCDQFDGLIKCLEDISEKRI